MGELIIRDPTLIPEAHSYGIAILLLFSLSSFSLASWVQGRWLAGRGVDFHSVYALLLSATVLFGAALLHLERLLSPSLAAGLAATLTGVLCGLAASRLDRAIVRQLVRRQRVGVLAKATTPRRAARTSSGAKPGSRPPGGVLLIIGALEELVFRGILVQLCFLLPSPALAGLALACTVAAFGLSHIHFGWPHVAAKLPLGVLALATVLLFGNVIGAIAAHVVFNGLVWRYLQRRPVELRSPEASAGTPSWMV